MRSGAARTAVYRLLRRIRPGWTGSTSAALPRPRPPDAPRLRLEARAVLGLEPAHVLNAGAGDVDGPVGSLRECIGPAQPVVLDEGCVATAVADLHGVGLDGAQVKPPAPIDPKAVRRLGFARALYTSFEVLVRQTWVLQGIRRGRIEGPAGQGFPIERPPIGRECEAVGGKFDPPPVGPAQRLPIGLHHHVLFRL